MTHKSKLSIRLAFPIALLLVEEITAPNECFVVPPTTVHSINGNLTCASVYGSSLVQSLLSHAKKSVAHAQVLVYAFSDLYGVFVELAYSTNGGVRLVEASVEGKVSDLLPIKTFC